MATKSQKIRVGVFAATTVALCCIVVIVFGGLRFWEHHRHYRIVFKDSVMGLDNGAQVYLDGIKVGSVEKIEIASGDLQRVIVSVSVASDAQIRADTKASLAFAGITGLKVIDMSGGTFQAPQLAEGGDIQEGESTLDKFTKKAEVVADQSEQLMAKANKIVDNLVAVSDPQRFAAMSDIMEKTHATADNLAEASAAMKSMVAENRVALKQSIESIHQTAQSASEMMDGQVSQIATNANDLISEVKGLIHDNEAPLRAAVFDLKQASRSFKDLAREVRQRPSRLLFSSAPSDRTLP